MQEDTICETDNTVSGDFGKLVRRLLSKQAYAYDVKIMRAEKCPFILPRQIRMTGLPVSTSEEDIINVIREICRFRIGVNDIFVIRRRVTIKR